MNYQSIYIGLGYTAFGLFPGSGSSRLGYKVGSKWDHDVLTRPRRSSVEHIVPVVNIYHV